MNGKPHLMLYNTETRQIDEITPIDGKTIKMYTCGPTVYNFAHIGNFRCYVFEDLLRRSLKYFGYPIIQVMNLTDIDDKTIRGAIANNQSLNDYTAQYKKAFFDDLKTLGIEPVEHYPAATDYIPQMIAMIETLIEKEIAYKGSDNSIYFSIDRFPSYGRLSHLKVDELQAAASNRIDTDEYDKEHVADFTLWKAYDPKRDGDVYWDSPFGKGRPGWHIECSAMAIELLGESIDIHCGGVDNMFPHHENEIAQSESCTSKNFVRHWMHCEHLLVENKKMSKSLGNFYTLRDLLDKGFTGSQIRYLLLQTHYRMQLNFTMQGLDSAVNSLTRIKDFATRLYEITQTENGELIDPILKRAEQTFSAALADDLNISPAMAAIFDLIREVNTLIDQQKLSQAEALKTLEVLKQFDTVLGVLPLDPPKIELNHELEKLLENRQKARAEKRWADADHYRDEILARGYIIEDTPSGARLKKR